MPDLRRAALFLLLCLAACGPAKPPLPLAQNVDLNLMYGGWYIVATIPNWFEKGLVNPYDVYSRRPDGDIREEFYLQKGGFDAPRARYDVHDWVRPGSGNAHWRVRPFWPLDLPFLLLYVDPRGRYALFGEESRDLGWVFARTPQVSDADYAALLGRLRDAGYDPGRFLKFVQRPADIGQPGFWSDGVAAHP